MARFEYGAGPASYFVEVDTDTVILASTELDFFDDEDNPITDLLDAASSPITSVFTDAEGRLPLFFGPDDVRHMWAGRGTPEFIVRTIRTDRGFDQRLIDVADDTADIPDLTQRVDDLETFNDDTLSPGINTAQTSATNLEADVTTIQNEDPKPGEVVFYGTLTADESIPDDTFTEVPWDVAHINKDGIWDVGTPTDIVLQWDGLYEASYKVAFNGSTSGNYRQVRIEVDDGVTEVHVGLGMARNFNSLSRLLGGNGITFEASTNDIARMEVYQNTGGALGISSNAEFASVYMITYLGPLV